MLRDAPKGAGMQGRRGKRGRGEGERAMVLCVGLGLWIVSLVCSGRRDITTDYGDKDVVEGGLGDLESLDV